MRVRANAKLLLSGEYLVLAGAEALAIPLKFGQELAVSDGNPNLISWISTSADGVWFKASFSAAGEILESSDSKTSQFVSELMLATNSLNQNFLGSFLGKTITVTADFNLAWGIGSSSSLIAIFAQLASIHPLALHSMVSNGSGYDVVTALSSTPIFYKKTEGVASYHSVRLPSVFQESVYFAYLGTKENSAEGVTRFLSSNNHWGADTIAEVSEISRSMATVENSSQLCQLMDRHEAILSQVLGIKGLKQLRFPDFDGSVKSLGAWGGDFAMFCSHNPSSQVYSYIASKGLSPIFRFNDISLGYE